MLTPTPPGTDALPPWLWLPAALLALLVAVGSVPLLRRLGEPADEDPEILAGKIPYGALARPRFAIAVAAVASAAMLVAVPRVPLFVQPAWWVLGSLGVLLGCIDAVTTWLPATLTRLLWLGTVVGLLIGQPWQQPGALPRILIGAAATGAFFWLVWRISHGIGFGDVRLAPVLGAVTAAVSIELLIWAMVLGTALGALHGLVRLLRGHRGEFAYGPALLAGPYVALLLG